MEEAKNLFNGVKTFDDSDDLIESLLNNPDIRSFVMKNDLTNKEIVTNMNAFLTYIDDVKKDKDGNTISNTYEGFSPVLSFSDGIVSIKYSKIKKDEPKTKIKNIKMLDELLDANLEDYSLVTDERRLLYQYARTFINSFDDPKPMKGLYISGTFRTGKTYLAAAIGNELANKGYDVIMAYYPELSSYLKSSIGSDEFQNIVDSLKYCDLLILDDFGGEAVNPFIRDEVLSVVLNHRMVKGKPVIFTSNIPMARLSDTSLRKDGSEGEKIKALRIIERIKELSQEYFLLKRYEELNKKNY